MFEIQTLNYVDTLRTIPTGSADNAGNTRTKVTRYIAALNVSIRRLINCYTNCSKFELIKPTSVYYTR